MSKFLILLILFIGLISMQAQSNKKVADSLLHQLTLKYHDTAMAILFAAVMLWCASRANRKTTAYLKAKVK